MQTIDTQDKTRKRFLKGIARRAGRELQALREIPATPEPLHYFYDVLEAVFVANAPQRHLDPHNEGKVLVGVYCMVVPEELIYAAGAVPVRLCAGCFESSQIGEDRIPRDGCPLVKSSMGLTLQKGLSVFDCCDVVIIPTTCDAKRKLGEELSAFKKVWMLEVPHIKYTDFSRRVWIEQLIALRRELERLTEAAPAGRRITARRLQRRIEQGAVARHEMRTLLSLRSNCDPVIWGRQALAVANAYGFSAIEDWTRHLADLNRTLQTLPRMDRRLFTNPRPRILIAGSPAVFPNLKIPSLVEEMGGLVVCDESCAGDRLLYDPVGPAEKNLKTQIAALGSRYMAPCICPSFTPNDDRLIVLKRMVRDFSVDGILYHVLKGCVVYDFEVHRVERAFKDQGVALLRIETDYNPEDVEQLRTRIEAFLEMLKTRQQRSVERQT